MRAQKPFFLPKYPCQPADSVKNPVSSSQSAIANSLIKKHISCYASKLNKETGSPARSTRIVEKLTVKLDAQQLSPTR